MNGTFLLQFGLTAVFGIGVLWWAWSGFSRMHFGLRTVFSWSALALSFPAAALANRALKADLERVGISATGLLLATFAVCSLVALSATTEQASRAMQLCEAALVESVFARDIGGFRTFLKDFGPTAPVGTIVIPAFNEMETIADVIEEATKSLKWPILVVDDGSLDATSQRAAEAGAFVVRLPKNLGVGAAVRLGIRLADSVGSLHVLQLDADGQHPAEQARGLLSAASGVASTGRSCLVVGNRFAKPGYEIGRIRKAAIELLSRRVEKNYTVRIMDPSSGFRLFAGRDLVTFAAEELPTEYLGDTFGFLQLALAKGFNVVEAEVEMRPRQGGEASSKGFDNMRFLLRVLVKSSKRV